MTTSDVTRDLIHLTICASLLIIVIMVPRCVDGSQGGVCSDDKFGYQCRLHCHCADDEPCDVLTGKCPGACLEGWSGPHCQRQNVALGMPTDMKTPDWSKGARAVDGDPGTCVTSSSNRTGWWRVDMLEKRTVFFMDILFANHTARQGRVRVHVSDYVDTFYGKPCTRIPASHKISTFACDLPSSGRYFGIINKEGQITLCEVNVFVCSPFTYGVDCSRECACHDPLELCNTVTGSCSSGCRIGWTGSSCTKPCTGSYGRGCRQTCGRCYGNEPCDHVTGSCLKGCAPGWKGARCKLACDPGTYGIDCVHPCHNCLDNETCDSASGVCPWRCDSGWQGPKCDRQCEPGRHGQSCQFNCGNCYGDSVCDRRSGLCPIGCTSGYEGLFCTKECISGKWGPNCQLTCGHCNNPSCDRATGQCDETGCLHGYHGYLCTAVCEEWSYGPNCKQICGACETPCDVNNGTCLTSCLPGWSGPLCTSKCNNKTYGVGCMSLCGHCANEDPCHHVTGHCLPACAKGYQKPFCQMRLLNDRLGKPNLLTLLLACMVVFVSTMCAVATCLVIRCRQGSKGVVDKPNSPFKQTIV
ncbi:unnamed protein product [Lymnaea stagnalis]|uniref:Fucolectin tachylectin-4 pentraxin-1 domain-containing protein n=1 Tax=Lymnaea stagnalis TaxID=6523 RepID=A0AAV2H8B0_LYMST